MKLKLEGLVGMVLMALLLGGCPGSSSDPTDGGVDGDTDGGDGGSGVDPGHPGAPCSTDEDCLFDGRCWVLADGFRGGYCTIEGCQAGTCPEGSACFEFADQVKRCVDTCTDNVECRLGEGYVCDVDSTCWPDPGTVEPGGPCNDYDDCMGGTNALCIGQAGFLDGYCIIMDCSPICPDGSECRPIFAEESTGCVPTCGSDLDCRAGYVCNDEPDSAWDKVCMPGCSAESCPEPLTCVETEEWSGHWCEDLTHLCSPDNTEGDCPKGQVCSGTGECVPFECNDTILEPNEDSAQALSLPSQDTFGLQICEGDEDWFSFVPEQADTLYQMGIDSNLASGELEIHLLDSLENLVDEARLTIGNIQEENRPGTTNIRSLALLAVPGTPIHYLKVFGRNGAVNNYTLLSKTLDFQDGPVCTDLYSVEDCRAQAPDGSDDFSLLIPFPGPQPLDPLIGDGVFFDDGLVGSDVPAHESSSIRWARRELIMLVRNAIFEVQKAYPGTAPLGIGDIGLIDGATPWGHPNHAHDQGRNVDIAYYIKPEFHRQWGNLVYRQICCDFDHLFGYTCVDMDESSDRYGTCMPGSENTHIVDIPRTALFLVKLTTGNRLRAVGVDTALVPALQAEYQRLLDDGIITQQEHDAIATRTKSTLDHESWLWHFHHMHVSFCDKECDDRSSRSLVLGPWAGMSREEQRPYLRYWIDGDRSGLEGTP
jgi:hypothetical protein